MPDECIGHWAMCQSDLNHLYERDTEALFDQNDVVIGHGKRVHVRWIEGPAAWNFGECSTLFHAILL